MTAPNIDFLTAAIRSWRIAETEDQWTIANTEALLGIGQQLRRIADQWEQPLEPVTTVLAETQYPGDDAFRAYLAREGRK